jgi:hypothetical protein
MKNLALRLTLLGLFVAAAGAAAYLSWTGSTRARQDDVASSAFDASAIAVERDLLELRAAQQGYVAAGQGDQFWASNVDVVVARLRGALNSLRTQSTSESAQAALDNASSALQDFEQMDRRARDYAHGGQKLLASDLIFTNGFELTGAAAATVEQARLAEGQVRRSHAAALERRGLAAAGGALAAGLFIIALLVPRDADPLPVPEIQARPIPRYEGARPAPRATTGGSADEGWSPAKVVTKAKAAPPRPAGAPRPTAAPAAAAPIVTAAPMVAATVDVASAAPAATPVAPPVVPAPIDLPGVASLCSDLARVVDTQALPAILARAAAVLDAPGIVLWIADPDGRELSPIVTHGYPQQLVSRLGTILRDAENATASAFRTSLLQTVNADAVSNGAIAAPLVTPAGCVGVMAAEVRSEGEKNAAKLAVATIVAAQLATLVGPPSARAHARVEAAGA